MKPINCLRSLLLLAAATPFVSAVTLTTPGVMVKENFDTAPTVANWGSTSISGPNSSVTSHAELDSAVGSFSVSGIVALASTTTLGSNANARHYSGGGNYVFTCPTQNAYTGLVATVTNGTMQLIESVSLTYDLIVPEGTGDDVAGHGVYYSQTGQAGSWTRITSLSAKNTSSAQMSTISGLSIAPGGKLYVLWADDNAANKSPDQTLGLDNVEWTCTASGTTPPPPPPTAPAASATRRYRAIWNDDPATKITIAWEQVTGTAATLHYDTVDRGRDVTAYPNVWPVDRQVTQHAMKNCFARLNNLQPDTTYYFVLSDGSGVSERYSFRTAPNTTKPFTFISGGDTRSNQLPRQRGNKLVAKLRPLFVIFGGDMTSNSTDAEWQVWLDDWQLTTTSDKRLIPITVTRGNHESVLTSLPNLFDCPSDVYYAYNVGGNMMRVYTLNSQITPGGVQGQWLSSDLAANSARVRHLVASYHVTIRPHTDQKPLDTAKYAAWAQVFYDNGVDLVIENDSHVMKRTQPLKPSTGVGSNNGYIAAPTDPKASVYVGEGCWGAPLRPANRSFPWTIAYGAFNSFEYYQVSWEGIVLRSPLIDSEPTTGETSEANPFVLPAGIRLWEPKSAATVTPVIAKDAPARGRTQPQPTGATLTIAGDGGQR
jgi:hypothetical protein